MTAANKGRKWGPCCEPGCPTLVSTTYCDDHTPAAWATSNRRSRLPADWDRLVAAVMKRDRRMCYLCGAYARDVDHVRRGDDHSLDNLAAICGPCHRSKSGREGALSPRRRTSR